MDNAKLLALDTFGAALAAAPLDIGQLITGYAASAGPAVIWGTEHTASPKDAALANGTLCSGLDFDPGFHLTTHTLPAAIAAGEGAGASGRAVLEGFIAGYETGARLIEALDSARHEGRGVTSRGWYHVGLVGPVASAVAAGKVLGLDQSRLQTAVGLAVTTAGGVRQNFGTMAKALQAGNAASQGVQSAQLALAGFGADPDTLEAPLGLLAALGIPEDATAQAIGKLGSRWELLADLKVKRFPACTPAHQPVQVALQLQREHGFRPEDVQTIEAQLHDKLSLIRLDPPDHIAAGFSLPFLVAVALVDGELTLDQVTEERIHQPLVRELMSRVRRASTTSREGGPEQLTIHLKDGGVLTGTAESVDRLDSAAEIEAKFRSNAARAVRPPQVEAILEAAMRLQTLPDITQLTETL
ncbi:MAG TPA: MmgE/PrpD family protein, partial [Chloroflexota bacterium]|nr:MmgE/PrpD family protein [Chloroflexota bacterium]